MFLLFSDKRNQKSFFYSGDMLVALVLFKLHNITGFVISQSGFYIYLYNKKVDKWYKI